MPSELAIGIACMTATGFVQGLQGAVGKVMVDQELPYSFAQAIASWLSIALMAPAMYSQKLGVPARPTWRLLFLRSLWTGLKVVALSASVICGTNIGEMSAMFSVSSISSPLLSRLLLGEPLEWKHAAAAVLCIVGAVLLTRPPFLLGGEAISALRMLGVGLALLAGVLQSVQNITSRMLAKSVHPYWEAVTVLVMSSVLLVVQGATIDRLEYPDVLGPVEEHPVVACLCLASLTAILAVAKPLSARGCQTIPAAVSTILGFGMRMTVSYLAEMLFFGAPPDAMTLTGAGLMLSSCLVVSIQWRRAPPQSLPSKSSKDGQGTEGGLADEKPDDDAASLETAGTLQTIDSEDASIETAETLQNIDPEDAV